VKLELYLSEIVTAVSSSRLYQEAALILRFLHVSPDGFSIV